MYIFLGMFLRQLPRSCFLFFIFFPGVGLLDQLAIVTVVTWDFINVV